MLKTICLILLLSISNVFCQETEKSKNDSLRFKSIEMFREVFWNTPIKYSGWTTDYEKLYSKIEKEKLNDIIEKFENETTIEIGIVTLDTLRVSKNKFEDLSLRIAKSWGIGKLEKDNGILIAISKSYRQIRIQNGNGIEKILSDDETKEIIENHFIPGFKKGDYFEGTLQGLNELIRKLKSKI